MEKVCVIVGAATTEEKDFLQYYKNLKSTYKDSYVIAADKGYEFLSNNHIATDLIVGDFDSLGKIPEGSNVIKHPVMKDDTDLLLAIKEGLKRGCTFFAIFGGLGGRLDHTFGNLQLLGYLREHGARGILYGDRIHATIIKNEKIEFDANFCGILSVFAFGGLAEGVNLKNLKYELNDACLWSHIPLGVSNEFIGKSSKVEVRNGELLIMWEKDNWQWPNIS
ncbi:MAG: thiamine diphosphokinase [Lachnospiraceae bacterium]|nr:thiamine diphosphokinase [Lachnospiraceae bacterium]